MPTPLDTELRPEVELLLEEFGRPVMVRLVEESFDPQTDEVTHEETDVKTKGIVEGYSTKLMTARYIPTGGDRATLIQEGDLQVTVPGLPFDEHRRPKPNDQVFLNNDEDEVYTVISSQLVSTGEQDALYILQVRGSQ